VAMLALCARAWGLAPLCAGHMACGIVSIALRAAFSREGGDGMASAEQARFSTASEIRFVDQLGRWRPAEKRPPGSAQAYRIPLWHAYPKSALLRDNWTALERKAMLTPAHTLLQQALTAAEDLLAQSKSNAAAPRCLQGEWSHGHTSTRRRHYDALR